MLYYATISQMNTATDIVQLFCAHGAEMDDIFLDTSLDFKKPGSAFQLLKEHLVENDESLTIDSLRSFGKTSREIAKELQWFTTNAVPLFVLDIPSTFCETASAIEVLSECYNNLAAAEIQRVKEEQRAGIDRTREQNKPFGRPRIAYPANWPSVYAQWSKGEISISEFMQLTGLKKGTLYNLIKQYKDQQAAAKEA